MIELRVESQVIFAPYLKFLQTFYFWSKNLTLGTNVGLILLIDFITFRRLVARWPHYGRTTWVQVHEKSPRLLVSKLVICNRWMEWDEALCLWLRNKCKRLSSLNCSLRRGPDVSTGVRQNNGQWQWLQLQPPPPSMHQEHFSSIIQSINQTIDAVWLLEDTNIILNRHSTTANCIQIISLHMQFSSFISICV